MKSVPLSLKYCATNLLGEDVMIFEQLGEPEPFPSFLPVPANVREYASKHRVGTPLTLYRSRHLLFAIIRCAVETVGLTIATGYFIKEYIDGIILDRTYPLPATNYSEQIFQRTQQTFLWVTLGLAIYAIICAISFWRYYREYQQKLYLCQYGQLRLGRNKEESIRWSEVTDMFGGSDKLLVLHREDGERFVVSESWSYNKELNTRIARILTERLLPQAIERFEKGMPLSFGTLLIVSAGIRYEGKVIPWSDLEDIQDKNGVLAIKTKGKWQHHMLINTPLIAALVKHAMRSRLVVILRNYVTRSWEMGIESRE
jgi:uncharacterized protein DUF6585